MATRGQWITRVFAAFMAGVVASAAYVAYRTRRVPTPRRPWLRFYLPGTQPLSGTVCNKFQGIYTITEGKQFFGETAVVQCSYAVERGQQVFYLSFFCQKNSAYFICRGRQHRATLLLNGHWRRAAANGSGLIHLVVKATDGSMELLQGKQPRSALWLKGRFGHDNHRPSIALRLQWQGELPHNHSFEIIGHRGAARNVDFLHVSENSLEMMKMAAPLGATGVEIDVRLSKDGVPVVFHDSFLSVHTTRGKIYGGMIHHFTLAELKKLRLRKGGTIPTLDECLHTILYKTPLRMVWLDMKKECDLQMIVNLQQRYNDQAKLIGRTLTIYLGIPDETMLNCFIKLPNHRDIPSLTELSPQVALDIGAKVWAPQYTGGFQRGNVQRVQAGGTRAFVWSLDSRYLINLFVTRGGFDGLVTNTPSVVAHWYYTNQAKTGDPIPHAETR